MPVKPCKHATLEVLVCPICTRNRERANDRYRRKPHEIKEKVKAWRETNVEKHKTNGQNYYKKNIAKFQARGQTEAERVKNRARVKRHNEAKPQQRLARVHRRRALKMGVLEGDLFTWRDVLERDGPTCYICGLDTVPDSPDLKLRPTVEHLRPLSEGGPHSLERTAIAHFSCNCSKGRLSCEPGSVPGVLRERCRARIRQYLTVSGPAGREANLAR